MVYGKLLFEIPVYRTSFEKFSAELRAEKEAYMRRSAQAFDEYATSRTQPTVRDEHLKRMEQAFDLDRIRWDYNQVIGWIRLKGNSDVIKAEYFFARERIFRRPKRRTFDWCGKAPIEVWIPDNASSLEVFNLLMEDLEQLQRERPFKGRFVDLEAFRNIGPFIDWKNAVI